MFALIDLSYLLQSSEQQDGNWPIWLHIQVQALQKKGFVPECILPVAKKDMTGAIKKKLQELAIQAPLHYVSLEAFPPSLQAQVLANFLQDRQVRFFLSYQSDTPAMQSLIAYAQNTNCAFKVIKDAQEITADMVNEAGKVSANISNSALPTLAIVSPYPPQKTGIADYLAQLLPELKRHYLPVLVIDNALDRAQFNQFDGQVIHADEFIKRPELHHRVLYQIGNSPAHLYALALLEQIPGCVVLHDLYLGNTLAYGEFNAGQKHQFIGNLIDSHGPQALLTLKESGLDRCINHYPCSLLVFKHALAIGVHTQYAQALARQWFDPLPEKLITTLPFPKPLPALNNIGEKQTKQKILGLPENALVVSSFGFGTPSKLHETIILAWLESELAQHDNSFLIFVGEYSSRQYEQTLALYVPTKFKNRIRFTGFVNEAQYQDYLRVTDIAVQLRDQSRGESSAAIMDCLAHQIPVIANNLGTVMEFPRQIIWKIDHQNMMAELMIGLNTLHQNSTVHKQLALAGYQYIQTQHHPADTASAYQRWIENSITQSSKARERELIGNLQKLTLDQHSTAAIAKALVFNRPALGKNRFLLDISDTAKHDKRTGIQRVVRSLTKQWLTHPPKERDIYPIYVDEQGAYRYAYDYLFRELNIPYPVPENDLLQVRAKDLYLGLDLNLITVVDHNQVIQDWRAHGVEITHIVYDLLPIQYPQWFLPFVEYLFRRWLAVILNHSDRLLADSQTIAHELNQYIKQQAQELANSNYDVLKVGWFHHGCDLAASLPTCGMSKESSDLISHLKNKTTFLMVSTIEPRKGYDQTLDAFDILWQSGSKANLVIVGKAGWYVDKLIDRLHSHPRLGSQLFWVSDISDEFLDHLYQEATAVICASYAEGFGLPIIEAAHHHTSVIARDIAVFREVGGDGVDYFRADTAEQLSQFLFNWLNLKPNQRASIKKIALQTWSQSAVQAQHFLFKPAFD